MSEEIEIAAEIAMETAELGIEGSLNKAATWIEWASMSTMVMALPTAIGGLFAGMTSNEAIVDRQNQISELIHMNRMELQSEVQLTRLAVMELKGDEPDQAMLDDIKRADDAVRKLEDDASEDVEDSEQALHTHELFAIGTTIVSLAITLTGMAVITRRKYIWSIGLLIALGGAVILTAAVTSMISSA